VINKEQVTKEIYASMLMLVGVMKMNEVYPNEPELKTLLTQNHEIFRELTQEHGDVLTDDDTVTILEKFKELESFSF